MSAAGRMALAIILAWLMPWAAVRRQRRSDRAFRYLCDVLVIQNKRLDEYEPKQRHLRIVR